MENLGNHNLFTSHFIMGCAISDNVNIDCIDSLRNWLKFKDSDFEMNKYRVSRTQYVAFLHEIDLLEFKEYLNNLIIIYKKTFPYGEKEDFIKHVFNYSLYDLQNFINREYRFLGSPSNKSEFDFYCFYEDSSNEYLDFAIPTNKTIEHYKQYYKRVIQLINDIHFEEVQSIDESVEENEEILSDLITHREGEKIVENLKVKYRGIMGKRLKLLLMALQETGLLPKERIASKFHRCCNREFDWEIASYTAMNDYEFNEYTDTEEFEEMKSFLEGV